MYQGKFKLKNPQKYVGDYNNVIYRSSWELALMVWCDTNTQVTSWSSEEVIIPYLCPTDNRWHRYFVDFHITFLDGSCYYIELKPEKYTKAPEPPKSKNGMHKKKHLAEVLSYVKNQAKWDAADKFAQARDAKFQVWTEKTLQKLGITLIK